MSKKHDILNERASVWSQMTAMRDSDAAMDAETRQSWDRAEARLQELTEDYERLERADNFQSAMSQIDLARQITPDLAAGLPTAEASAEAQYREAFEHYVRFGMQGLTSSAQSLLAQNHGVLAGDQRAAGVGTSSAGGYLVPLEFRNTLIETLKFFSSMRQVAEVLTTTSGVALPWPTSNDTANVGAILAENTAVTEQDFTFGTAQLGAYMYTSKMVRVSLQLIQDSGIDIDTFLPRKLGERIGRIQNQHYTTGTGSSQPQGLITGGTAVQAAAGNTTTVPYSLLIDAIAGVDPAYLAGGNCKWMLSSTAIAAFRKVVDSQNRPLWEPSVQLGQADSILGYPIVLNNDLAVPGVSAKFGAFGDFKAGYVIRDVTGVETMRLSERYAEFLQVAYLSYQRSDGLVQDSSAYRVLQNSAT